MPLVFRITADSIVVNPQAGNSKRELLNLHILNKPVCNWNETFSEGETSYEVSTNSGTGLKHGNLKIVFSSTKRFVSLVYDGMAARIFMIKEHISTQRPVEH